MSKDAIYAIQYNGEILKKQWGGVKYLYRTLGHAKVGVRNLLDLHGHRVPDKSKLKVVEYVPSGMVIDYE